MTPLERLKELFKDSKTGSQDDRLLRRRQYYAVCQFCIDCSLLSPAEIEEMENERGKL